MAKFKHGFWLGAAVFGTYALLTTSKSGRQRRQDIKQYVVDLNQDTTQVTTHVRHLNQALQNLGREISQTTLPTLQAIAQEINGYTFQNEHRFQQVNQQVQDLQTKATQVKPWNFFDENMMILCL